MERIQKYFGMGFHSTLSRNGQHVIDFEKPRYVQRLPDDAPFTYAEVLMLVKHHFAHYSHVTLCVVATLTADEVQWICRGAPGAASKTFGGKIHIFSSEQNVNN